MKNLRRLRAERKLKQAEVAAVLGITRRAYGNRERGDSELKQHEIEKLCEFYGVSEETLLHADLPAEEIKYSDSGWMLFNSEFHTAHSSRWSDEERAYICQYVRRGAMQEIAAGLGRTAKAVSAELNRIRKQGKFEYYKNMG